MAANVKATSSAAEYVRYIHQLMRTASINPSPRTQQEQGAHDYPGTYTGVNPRPSPAINPTNNGHMRRHRTNTASTRNAHANIMAARVDVSSMSPTQEVCSLQEMFCLAALANANTGTMYTDLTGAFPIRSFKNMQYIFVAYIYDLNTIIV
jgi:hypothetical protein